MIWLTWSDGAGMNSTYVERNTAASWARGSGTEVYNGSKSFFNDSNCSAGTCYPRRMVCGNLIQ